MERVRQLEKRHVQVHSQLLQALDELYLTKEDRQNFVLSRNQEAQLQERHMLHMSLEKSVAISKAMKRTLEKGADEEEEYEGEERIENGDAGRAAIDNFTGATNEDKVAARLNQLCVDTFGLDEELVKMLEKLHPLEEEYNTRCQEFAQLKIQLSQITSNLLPTEEGQQEIETTTDAAPIPADHDVQLERENTVLLELIAALSHLSRRRRE